MKKKLFLLFALLIALVATLLGVASWKLGDIVAAYKPQIQDSLARALGANVSLGTVSLSLLPRPEIHVDSIAIGSVSQGKPELSVGSLSAHAALLPLLQKRVELSSIRIDSPRVTLVKTTGGISIQGLPSTSNPASSDPTAVPPSHAHPASSQSATASPLAISIQRVEVRNGEIALDDQVANRTFSAKKLSLGAEISLEGSQVKVPDAQLSLTLPDASTLTVNATGLSIDPVTKQFALSNATLTTPAGTVAAQGTFNSNGEAGSLTLSAKALDLKAATTSLATIAPALTGYNLTGRVGMQITAALKGTTLANVRGPLTLTGITADLPGGLRMRDLSGDIALDGSPSDLGVSTSNLAFKLQDAPLSVASALRVRTSEIAVSSLTLKGFGGVIQSPSLLTLSNAPRLQTKPNAQGIALETVLQTFKPDLPKLFQGTLTSFTGDFSGIELQNPAPTAAGNGALLLTNGKLTGVNIPNLVLSKVDGLPLIAGNLRKLVPPQFEPLVASRDTSIKELRTSFTVGSGVVTISDLVVVSDHCNLNGKGTVGVNGTVNLTAALRFTPEFSQALTNRTKELKPLVEGDGRFTVPFLVRGQGAAIVVLPDVSALTQKLAVGAVSKSLDSLLKGNKGAEKSMKKIFGF
jgi:uncharacterized protein involved in outer membrane biogenesis